MADDNGGYADATPSSPFDVRGVVLTVVAIVIALAVCGLAIYGGFNLLIPPAPEVDIDAIVAERVRDSLVARPAQELFTVEEVAAARIQEEERREVAAAAAVQDSIEKAQADSLTAWNEANPCPPVFKADSVSGFMTLDGIMDFVRRHTCAPYRGFLDPETGRMAIQEDLGPMAVSAGGSRLAGIEGHQTATRARIMATVAWILEPLEEPFKLVPEPAQRGILTPVLALTARGVTQDANQEELDRYITSLDWARDIEPINPDWWNSVEWPENDTVRVNLPGYGEIGFADLWARMFWARRGPVIFEAAKAAFIAAR